MISSTVQANMVEFWRGNLSKIRRFFDNVLIPLVASLLRNAYVFS